eukprot:m.185102 g.185102  ORF g.185102 m.185102 type:complete len:577 (-) comp32219_c0_seq1:65-1795(-)
MDGSPSESMETDGKQYAEALMQPDSIMAHDVKENIKGYIQNKQGSTKSLIQLLSSNYEGYAQMTNLAQRWLESSGETEVTGIVQDHVKQLIKQNFDTEKAAKIFDDDSGTPDWLDEMILHKEWRSLIYELSEQHPNSLMLNYLIKLISDAGFQNEIAKISTIANHLDVFSRILSEYIAACINVDEEALKEQIGKITSLACASQHAYLYCQLLLHSMMNGPMLPALRRLSQEIHLSCSSVAQAARTEFLFMNEFRTHFDVVHAMAYVLDTKKISHHLRTIYNAYTSNQNKIKENTDDNASGPPSVLLLRFPGFLDIVVDELFTPQTHLKQEMFAMCSFLVAYAVSVPSEGDVDTTDELQQTQHALEEVLKTVESGTFTASSNAVLYEFMAYPIVCRGLLKWLEVTLLNPEFFITISTSVLPPHFGLLDEIGIQHPMLRDRVLSVLKLLFQCSYTVDSMQAIDLKRKIMDRILYLFALGHVSPVIEYMHELLEKADVALVVHFIHQMLPLIGPPYSRKFYFALFQIVNRNEVKAGFGNKMHERLAVTSFLRDAPQTDISSDEAKAISSCVDYYTKARR